MKDVAKHPWLWFREERNGTRMYYLRAAVPTDLVEAYGKTEIRKSLRTKDRKEADRLIMTEAALLNEEFERHRRGRDKVETSNVTKAQLWVLVLQWFRDQDQVELEAWQRIDNDEERANARELLRDDLGGFGDLDDPRTYDEIAQEADQLLNRNGFALTSSNGLHQYLVQELHNATMELLRRRLGRVDGNFDATTDTRFDVPAHASPANPVATAGTPNGMTLTELMDAFLDDPSGKSREKKTELGYDFTFRVMKEVVGEHTSVATLNRDHCRAIQRVFIRMPSNATKRFPGMPLVEVADHAERTGLKPMAPGTVNSYISKMSSFLGWACREEYIATNPAQRLLVEDDVDDKDKRDPFSMDQLKLIFNAPLYRGCKNDGRGYAIPGDQVVRRARFWVPLIALFHGMRMNEICQLSLNDIETMDGIDCMRVQTEMEDHKAKSRAARRVVPVHPDLKRMGFTAYVAKMRDQGETRLFPELKQDKRGYYSDSFNKWFRRFLVKIKAKTERTSFHSFRHSWRDAMREADVKDEVVFAMGGWSDGGATHANYGSGIKVKTRADAIAKVRYDGLDLSHLYVPGTS